MLIGFVLFSLRVVGACLACCVKDPARLIDVYPALWGHRFSVNAVEGY
ncbi:Hypothetical protein Cul210932_1257 [Corynebacterium ulcerans]|nr:Hypothetical protein Cul210932_1257 [Corynebacterium ulcerans]